jgi:hypothetical protein
MFCPGCGKQVVDGLRFCNACGTNLQLVQQALTTNSLSTPLPGTTAYPPNPLPPFDPVLVKHHKTQLLLKKLGVMSLVLTPLWAAIMGIIGNIVENISWQLGHFIADFAAFSAIFFLIGVGVLIYRRIIYKDAIKLSPILNNATLQTAPLPVVPFTMAAKNLAAPPVTLDSNHLPSNMAGRPLFSSPSRSFETSGTSPVPVAIPNNEVNLYAANPYATGNVYEQPTNQLHQLPNPEVNQ